MPVKALRSLGLGIAMLCLAAGAAQAQSQKPTVPDSRSLAILVRTTMIAFNHANVTGNYTVLRDLAAPSFANANSAARLAAIFRDWRERKLDISQVVFYPPEFIEAPKINKRNQLLVEGYFPTRPLQVNFGMLFQLVKGRWRLFGMQATTEEPE
jgi:hypothetical protein